MSRRRPLSDEEQTLWAGYARSIKPLRSAKAKPEPKPTSKADTAAKVPVLSREVVSHRSPPLAPAKSLPLTPLDRRLKQRVARGRDAIEARLDLHGMTQSEAHVALIRFLRRAQADGKKIALVVTGKGARDGVGERGVLRRQVPLWLSLPEFRLFVVGFEEAHVSHGGQGALYVRLRRAR